jgi:hypothetical protein
MKAESGGNVHEFPSNLRAILRQLDKIFEGLGYNLPGIDDEYTKEYLEALEVGGEQDSESDVTKGLTVILKMLQKCTSPEEQLQLLNSERVTDLALYIKRGEFLLKLKS